MRIGFDARHARQGLGIGTFVRSLARELVAMGHELVWFGDLDVAPDRAHGVRLVQRMPYPVLDGPVGRVLARRMQVDVFHMTGNTGWRRETNPPVVLTLHDLIFLTTSVSGRRLRQVVGHRYARRNVMDAVAGARKVAVPSETVAAEVRRQFPDLDPPVVVPNGVDLLPVLPAKADPPYLLGFGGRDPRKRTDLLLDVVRRVDGMRLLLLTAAGLPPGFVDRASAELREGRIELIDYLPRAGYVDVIGRAHALLYPSVAEGFGLPVLEAMSAGTPVIAGIAPSTREVGADAILPIDSSSPVPSMVAHVERLSTDPALASMLIRRGRERAQMFSWQRCATSYVELYEMALAL